MEFSELGGARVGWISATWPLVRISVSPRSLKLSGAVGRYEFAPDQVVAIEKYGSIPLFTMGLRIRHACPDYPARVIFWTFGSALRLLDRIKEAGFRPTAPAAAENVDRGFRMRPGVVAAIIAAGIALLFFANYLVQRLFA